jgi:hypothetical protein
VKIAQQGDLRRGAGQGIAILRSGRDGDVPDARLGEQPKLPQEQRFPADLEPGLVAAHPQRASTGEDHAAELLRCL